MKFSGGFLIFLFLVIAHGTALSNDIAEESLNEFWYVYDYGEQIYKPFPIGSVQRINAAHQFLDLKNNLGKYLQVCIPEGTALLIEHALVEYASSEGCTELSIDSLYNVYGKNILLLTVYKPILSLPEVNIYLFIQTEWAPDEKTRAAATFDILTRDSVPFKNFRLSAILLIFLMSAIIVGKYPRIAREFFSLIKTFSVRVRDDRTLTSKIFGKENLIFIGALSFVIGFLITSISTRIPSIAHSIPFPINENNLSDFFWSWLILSGITFAAYMGKYQLISVMSSLFKIRGTRDIYFIDFIRMGMIFYAIIFFTYTFLTLGFSIDFYSTILTMIAIFLIFRALLIFLKLLNSITHTKLHLFSYLCTTEIIPLVITLKVILQ